ncbi:MAG TPA: TraB/GumN family protein [Kofleriaceae bacterium]|jgi:uncharacterized protein YbaP (TraB family)
MKRTLVLLALVACQQSHQEQHQAAGSAGSTAVDPWAATGSASATWPPTFVEKHARAERLCPTVTPYFFELAKDGKVSHILGTRHIGVPFSKMPQVVHDDLHASKLAVFEVAPDDKTSVEFPEEPLRDELGSADWARFTNLVGTQAATMLERGAAAVATIAIAVDLEDTSAILDKEIEEDVGSAGIPAQGLETAEFQDHVLAKLLDLRMLKATIETTKGRAELDKDSAKDLREYCAGSNDSPGTDAETRAKLESAGYSDAEIDAQDDMLVYSRNRDWIPKLEKLFANGGVFVVVGADHLIGDKGVIALLRKRGFTATRITK